MQLGFVSAILPELTLPEVFITADLIGYETVELMCWPRGKADRRYAGVTHIDVENFTKDNADEVNQLASDAEVSISGLGYYPNPLTPDEAESKMYVEHIKKVITASKLLGVNQMNTFIGRDWKKSVDDNWSRFLTVWKPIIKFAEDEGVRIGIENCPMFFSEDEWPSGKNLAHSPAIWSRMFNDISSDNFGLNYDPSHMIWQQMDYLAPMRDFADKLFHIHAKDVRIDKHKLDQVGILANPPAYHTPKLPGMGDVNWGQFFSILGDTGYTGAICVEVEDRVFEGDLDLQTAALEQSHNYLRQYIPES